MKQHHVQKYLVANIARRLRTSSLPVDKDLQNDSLRRPIVGDIPEKAFFVRRTRIVIVYSVTTKCQWILASMLRRDDLKQQQLGGSATN